MSHPVQTPAPRWHRHFFYRKETLKTTWKLRLAMLLLVLGLVTVTRGFWTRWIAQSLICSESAPHSDALLLENFDASYLVFERAAALHREGVAPRILVPIAAAEDEPNSIAKGTVELMAKVAWIQNFEMIPIHEVEPISLNAAKEIRDFLKKESLKSVVVVTPAFRGRRSALVYDAVLTPAGVRVACVPVFGTKSADNWSETWHGIQDVAEQFIKLQYYRFYVLL
jgi:hypothetical protein